MIFMDIFTFFKITLHRIYFLRLPLARTMQHRQYETMTYDDHNVRERKEITCVPSPPDCGLIVLNNPRHMHRTYRKVREGFLFTTARGVNVWRVLHVFTFLRPFSIRISNSFSKDFPRATVQRTL
jgi:hypothetical protein